MNLKKTIICLSALGLIFCHMQSVYGNRRDDILSSLVDKRVAREERLQRRLENRVAALNAKEHFRGQRDILIKKQHEFEKFFKEMETAANKHNLTDVENKLRERETKIDKGKRALEEENKRKLEDVWKKLNERHGANYSQIQSEFERLFDQKEDSQEVKAAKAKELFKRFKVDQDGIPPELETVVKQFFLGDTVIDLKRMGREKEFLAELSDAIKKKDEERIAKVVERAKKDLDDVNKDLKGIEAELSGYAGDIIFRGIAGDKNWEMVEDLKVGDNIWEGFKNGVMLRGSLSVGDAIGTSVDGYVKKIFDGTLGKVEEFLGAIYRWFFHSSCKPFNVTEIVHWKKLIGNDLREIEFMIKNVEKLDSRGRTEILREFDSEEEEKETINLWRDFIEDLAITCHDLAEEIELRKGYYKKKENGFGVANCADRLVNKLLRTKEWLLSVKSLKDLANIPEAKSIIPAMKKSFDNYFDNIADQIRPLSDKKSSVNLTGGSSSSNRWSSSSSNYDSSSLGSDFPKGVY